MYVYIIYIYVYIYIEIMYTAYSNTPTTTQLHASDTSGCDVCGCFNGTFTRVFLRIDSDDLELSSLLSVNWI